MKTYFEARRRLAAFALALPLACLALGLMISAAFAGDDTVVHVGDRAIEGLDHGVGEDHRPRGECDAEDDGERGGE